jgi:hypothetical protein
MHGYHSDAIVSAYEMPKMGGDILKPVAREDLVAALKENRAGATRNWVWG